MLPSLPQVEIRATAGRKRTLLGLMRRAHLAHVRRVAQGAQREAPDLLRKFVLPRGTIPLLAFQSAARSMLAEAESWKDVMVRHGLSETLLQSLHQSLEHFDRAIERGIEAHRTHVGATAGLDEAGDDLVRIVRVLDPLNRFRFAEAPDVLAEWASFSHVVATPRPQAKDASSAA
jgi:hypothetical protein